MWPDESRGWKAVEWLTAHVLPWVLVTLMIGIIGLMIMTGILVYRDIFGG